MFKARCKQRIRNCICGSIFLSRKSLARSPFLHWQRILVLWRFPKCFHLIFSSNLNNVIKICLSSKYFLFKTHHGVEGKSSPSVCLQFAKPSLQLVRSQLKLPIVLLQFVFFPLNCCPTVRVHLNFNEKSNIFKNFLIWKKIKLD